MSAMLSLKSGVFVMMLALLWGLETWRPFFDFSGGRIRHGLRHVAIGGLNGLLVPLCCGVATISVATAAAAAEWGILRLASLPVWLQAALAILLLDGWLYGWHRLNHRLPWLWRFHRMHHADPQMDATTALRFHPGELLAASALRLPVIALLGIEVWHLLLYETLILAVTLFHHANISLGRWERPLSWLVVTPGLHKVHHSRWQPETDSNFSTLFSIWDRLFHTLRKRSDLAALRFGLDGFEDPRSQTMGGQLRIPLRKL